MAHTHTEGCERLHEALQSLQAQQQLPRGSMSAFAGQVVLPEQSAEPEGDMPDVEAEIAELRRALDALDCDRQHPAGYSR